MMWVPDGTKHTETVGSRNYMTRLDFGSKDHYMEIWAFPMEYVDVVFIVWGKKHTIQIYRYGATE